MYSFYCSAPNCQTHLVFQRARKKRARIFRYRSQANENNTITNENDNSDSFELYSSLYAVVLNEPIIVVNKL